MLGLGGGEFFLIVILALILIGPSKLPSIMRSLGKVYYEFKKSTDEFRDQINREINTAELRNIRNEITRSVSGQLEIDEITKPFREVGQSLRETEREVRAAQSFAPVLPSAGTTAQGSSQAETPSAGSDGEASGDAAPAQSEEPAVSEEEGVSGSVETTEAAPPQEGISPSSASSSAGSTAVSGKEADASSAGASAPVSATAGGEGDTEAGGRETEKEVSKDDAGPEDKAAT